MTIRGAVLPFVVILVSLGSFSSIGAQSRDSGDGAELSRQEVQARVMQQFERRVARELRLDRTQLQEVQQVMHSMLQERRELFQRRRALRSRIERFEAEQGNEAMARSILSETRAIRSAEARIEAEEEARLLEILSPTQVLRFQIMREELNERIRRMHREHPGSSPGARSRP